MRMSSFRLVRVAVLFVAALALAAASATTPAPARASESAAQTRWHVIQRGDTLAGLAARYGLSAESILQANGMADARALAVGHRLAVPQAGSPNAAPEAAAPEAVPAAADPLAGGVPAFKTRGKVIYVSLAQQRMWAYENGELAFKVLVSTGIAERATKPGTYRVKTKLQEAWSRVWQLRMPYWMGIYDVGSVENGIHAMPFSRTGRAVRWRVGTPGSYGCVVLNAKDAAALYKWAPMGTLVIIRH